MKTFDIRISDDQRNLLIRALATVDEDAAAELHDMLVDAESNEDSEDPKGTLNSFID